MSLTLLSNRYRVLNVLGDGGFGKTFLVEDTQMPSSRKCVLKQLKPVHDGTSELRQLVQDRFQREAATLEMLGEEHAQIPRLYAYFSEAEQFYLVQEWIDGVTIADKVQHDGAQHEQVVKSMISDLLGAIAYIHSKGIVHRDIKPDNIILRSHDNKPVLIDFGAVKEIMNTIVDSQSYSTRSIVVGTPGYMPTEQLAGRPVYASDIYSLGMTALYMLTGKIPQEIFSDPASGALLWRKHAPSVSPTFAAFLDRAIHTSTHQRFSTAQEMQMALQQLTLSTDPTQVNSVPVAYPGGNQQLQTPPVAFASPVSASAPTSVPIPTSTAVQDAPLSSAHVNSTATSSKNGLVIGSLVSFSILIGAVILGRTLSNPSVPSPELATDLNVTEPFPSEAVVPEEPAPPPVEIEPIQAPDASDVDPFSVDDTVIADASTPGSSWVFMGTASSGEGVSVNESSIRLAGEFVDFEYQIGDERIAASADCFENRWYAEQYGWYSPQSQATQSMLNFVCQ